MLDRALQWMNERYPEGFYCCNITQQNLQQMPFSGIVSLNTPVLFQLDPSFLQECITHLIDSGASPTASCFIMTEPVLCGTLGNIAMKVRGLNLAILYLALEI